MLPIYIPVEEGQKQQQSQQEQGGQQRSSSLKFRGKIDLWIAKGRKEGVFSKRIVSYIKE